MKLIKAASSELEAQYMHAALTDFSRDGARAQYAAWLKAQGRLEDAQTVLATIDVFHSLDAAPLQHVASETPWTRMLAIPLLQKFIEATLYETVCPPPPEGLTRSQSIAWEIKHQSDVRITDPEKLEAVKAVRDLAFPMLRPALELKFAPAKLEPELGASYLWGLPDIPHGESWPLIKELSDIHGREALPEEQHAAFVGQFAFSDMRGTLLGCELPTEGGFAVYTILELDHVGICETLVRAWNNKVPLMRHSTPQDLIEDKLGSNAPMQPHEMTLKEVLSLPDSSGPYREALPDCGYDGKYKEIYETLWEACDSRLCGFGGYLRATSGNDPSPDAQSLRLAILKMSDDSVITHFSIPAADLKVGRLDRVKNVWVDYH